MAYQQSKDCPIDGIYCSDPLTANQGGFLSLGRIVGDQPALWIETNENRILGFQEHDIILPMSQNLCLAYPWTIKKLNDTFNTSFVKHDIYQKIHYIHNQEIYHLPTHLAQEFDILDELINHPLDAEEKNAEEKLQVG